MKLYNTIGIAILVISFSCQKKTEKTPSETLAYITTKINDQKGYDKESYPLGLFTKEYYQQEADFAQKKIQELNTIEKNQLSESDQISLDLQLFILQEKVDRYKFESYLNPLLSDAGFHNDLIYQVKPLTNYDQVKKYISTLGTIPQFVDQHLILLREGLSKGISQPKVIFKGYR